MIFQKERFGVQHGRVLAKQEGLHFDELDVVLLGALTGEARVITCPLHCALRLVLISISGFGRVVSLVGVCSLGWLTGGRGLRLRGLVVLLVFGLGREGQALTYSQLLLCVRRRGWLLARLLGVLELRVEVCVDA